MHECNIFDWVLNAKLPHHRLHTFSTFTGAVLFRSKSHIVWGASCRPCLSLASARKGMTTTISECLSHTPKLYLPWNSILQLTNITNMNYAFRNSGDEEEDIAILLNTAPHPFPWVLVVWWQNPDDDDDLPRNYNHASPLAPGSIPIAQIDRPRDIRLFHKFDAPFTPPPNTRVVSWQSHEIDAAVINAKRVIRPFAKERSGGGGGECKKIGIWKVICR